ncbi:proteasome activator pa28, REG alpha/beta subunit [Agrocybe pediades]|nr:proteasome activator pa28, REG alpha/beta subunit [Agrocybe pediades]
MDSDTAKQLKTIQLQIIQAGKEALYTALPLKIISLHRMLHDMDNSLPLGRTLISGALSESLRGHAKSTLTPHKKRKLSETTRDDCARETDLALNADDCVQDTYLTTHALSLRDSCNSILKNECDTMIQLTDHIKMWLIQSFPRIKSCTTTKQDLQDDILAEFLRAQEAAFTMRDSIRLECLARAEIVSKVIEHANVKDYTVALREHDEQRIFTVQQYLRDIRNTYLALHDMTNESF